MPATGPNHCWKSNDKIDTFQGSIIILVQVKTHFYLLCSFGVCLSDFLRVGSARMAAWTFLYSASIPSASIPRLMYSLKCDWYFSGSSSAKICRKYKIRLSTTRWKIALNNTEDWYKIKSFLVPSYRQQHVHQKHISDEPLHQAPSSPYQTQQTSCHCEEYPTPHPELPVNNHRLFNLINH